MALLAAVPAAGCIEPEEPEKHPACRAASPEPVPPPGDPVEVLVLHDSTGEWGDLGVLYATMVANLAGHFREARVQVLPMMEYQRGDIDAHDVVFYLGTVYEEPIPRSFLDDFRDADDTTVVWTGSNLWIATRDEQADFVGRYGFDWTGTADDPAAGADTTFFRTVRYKDTDLPKHLLHDAPSGTVEHDPVTTLLEVVRPEDVDVVADITHSGSGETVPYIVRSDNLWVVADTPFTYLHFDDRYWAFTDLMHDFLEIDHEPTMKAMFRLEDVHPFVPPQAIDTVRGFIAEAGRPWNMAMVPVWADPLGVYNPDLPGEGWDYDLTDDEAGLWRQAVDLAYEDGAEMILHGYTHQLGERANPFNGVSGTDYEFWDAVNDTPVPGDNFHWAAERVDKATAAMDALGWSPWCFEVPHYQASMVDYFAINSRYDTVYHHGFYRDFEVTVGGDTYDMNDVLDGTAEGVDLSDGAFRRRRHVHRHQPRRTA